MILPLIPQVGKIFSLGTIVDFIIIINEYVTCCLLEPVEGGTEIMLKLRLSSTCQDIKLPIFTTDTIGMAKKKLQVQQYFIGIY